MPTNDVYPRITDLLPIDSIPDSLKSVQGVIEDVLHEVHYKDLIAFKSRYGESAFYNLTLLLDSKLGVEIPGTDGLTVLLNPGETAGTEIPITLQYRLEVLKYIKKFKIENLPAEPFKILKFATDLFNIPLRSLFEEIIYTFINSANPLQQFVTNFNTTHGPTLTLNSGLHPDTIVDLALQMDSNNFDVLETLFDDYILDIDIDVTFNNIKLALKTWFSEFSGESLKELFIPKIYVGINSINIGVEIPRNILQPIDPLTDEVYVDTARKSKIIFDIGSISFNSEGGFEFDSASNITFEKSEILNTGLRLEIIDMKLDLSRTKNIPEAIADGRPDDFVGVYAKHAQIDLPKKWFGDQTGATVTLFSDNLLIGTGGISGTIGIDSGGVLSKQIGNFILELDTFDLTLHQSAITHSHIHGNIEFPNFQMETAPGSGVFISAKIDLDGAIDEQGDFHITASTNAPITAIRIPDILEVKVRSFELGREDDKFYVEVAGSLNFLWNVPGLGNILPKEIDIKKLRIWETGKIEFAFGGVSLLSKPVTLPLGPVKITISALTIGSHEQEHYGVPRKYTVVGFDGGVNVNPGGVDVRANGVKLYFTTDNNGPMHIFLRIQGIRVDIRISSSDSEANAKVLISGWLSIKEPEPADSDAGDEFAGGVSIKLNKLNISATAAMRMRPKLPAFLVDLSLELPNAIPLGSTGLGIYGFRGLIGTKYVADKTTIPGLSADSPWWQYYKGKIPMDYKEGIQVSKFKQRNGFSFGAGASLATQTDKGRTFSSKLFFLLSLPDVFLLQGQAAILRTRIGLDDTSDPPFYALLAITSHSIEVALGVNYKIPEESGSIADVNGLLEMGFFWGNNAAWYINIGIESPEERRVRARLVTIFNVYFYFMMSSQGIRAGAGASWKFSKKLGPVGIEAGAYIDTTGRISFHPKQIGGSISAGGYLRIKVFKFKFGFSLDATLSGEAPKPFIITGSFTFKINLPWPFKDIEVSVELTWSFNSSLNDDPQPVIDAAGPQSKPSGAINVHTNEKFQVLVKNGNISTGEITEDYVIPMDSFIDIEFLHGLKPGAAVTPKFGGVTTPCENLEIISPQKAKSSQVKHEFEITEAHIKFWDGDSWENYNIYEASTPLHDLTLFPNNSGTTWYQYYKQGYFQIDRPKRYNKIRVMAQTPFSYFRQGAQTIIPEELNININTFFCEDHPVEHICVNFDIPPREGQPFPNYSYQPIPVFGLMPETPKQFGGMVFYVTVPANSTTIAQEAPVVEQPAHGYQKAIAIAPGNILEIYLPTACAEVEVYLSTGASQATVEFYRIIDVTLPNSPVQTFGYDLVDSQTKSSNDLLNGGAVSFIFNPLVPEEKVDKVVIIAEPLSATSQLSCDPVLKEADAVQVFLNQLAGKQCFVIFPNELFPAMDPDFNGFFQNSMLYGIPLSGTIITHEITYMDNVICRFRVYDNNGFECLFNLEMIETTTAAFLYKMIIEIQAIIPYPDPASVHGTNYTFQVKALLDDGKTATLRGTSCYPIVKCREIESTYLHDICYKSYDDYLIDQSIPTQNELQAEYDHMVEALNNTVQPLWRPNTYFQIELHVSDKISIDSSPVTHSDIIRVGFKTQGPLGQFHQWQDTPGGSITMHPEYELLVPKDRQLEFKLSGLQHYIDYSKSYPNADGNIINAKPLFYKNPSLLLFYTEPYTLMFFKNWDDYHPQPGTHNNTESRLEVVIKDPQEGDTGVNGVPPLDPVPSSWLAGGDLQMTSDVLTLYNLAINGNLCMANMQSINMKQEIYSVFQLGDGVTQYLKPMKLYHALFNLVTNYKSQAQGDIVSTVHKYAFQTSRYQDFEEQVQSWILNDEPANEKYAVYEIKKDFTASGDLTKCQQIVDGTLPQTDDLSKDYAETLDRLIDGAMMLGAQQAATTTEFNIIGEAGGGPALFGILIRNPEPFNDPKLPGEILLDPVNGSLILNFTPASGSENGGPGTPIIIFSKDRSKIFVTFQGMSIYPGSYEFTFRYFLYDGHNYAESDVQNVTINV